MPIAMRIKLSAMMFLQFMMLPVWLIPLYPYVQALPGGEKWAMWCGMMMGLGTFASPLVGMFADRFLNAEKVLAICNFANAAFLAACFFTTNPALIFVLLLVGTCFYMPTWGLTATIAMKNSTTEAFPQIRVFGSLGWVASAVFSIVGTKCFGIEKFDTTAWIFVSGAIAAVAGGCLAFTLPATEPTAKGTPMSVADALGLKAFVLFKDVRFLVFGVLIFLAMVPFQWYNAYNGMYLKESGFQYLTVTMNLGQAGEICFMLLIPLILKKFGYKWAMVIGLGALVFRYACFYGSAAFGCAPLDFGGILIHGLIFGLLVVGAQMYVNDAAPAELRNQAQGLVNLLTCGVGVFASNFAFEKILAANVTLGGKVAAAANAAAGANVQVAHDWSVPFLYALIAAVVLTALMAAFFNPKKTA